MTKTLSTVSINPACERIEPAGQRPVGMNAATLLIEKNTCAIVLSLHPQHGAASLGMPFDELRRRDTEPPRQPQNLVSADSDRLIVQQREHALHWYENALSR